jgi:4-carboxymuconolactone decarboxylase
MIIFKPEQVPKEVQHRPLFVGGESTMQLLLPRGVGSSFFSCIRTWNPNTRSKFHNHSSDQMLIVTDGKGMIATEPTKLPAAPGDIVFIPTEEKHWHGATKDSSFIYIQIQAGDSKTTQLED